ncbi:MAG: flagellar assembly protein FliH [Sulfurimonadaceae bacterium]|jgi:flagellar assembly protein FliH
MATVISNEKLSKHTIDKYNFKVLAMGGSQEKEEVSSFNDESHPKRRVSDYEPPKEAQPAIKEGMVESLLKQVDEVTSNFIKLQMKLETKEEEFKKELQKTKEEAYAQGVAAGKEEASKQMEKNYAEGMNQFSASIAALEKTAEQFSLALEGIKHELVSAALDISKEVIKVELSAHANEVAKTLASELIADLQGASKIRLKVNPKNHGALSEKMGALKNVEILSDSAISEGGVVALSDVGNIDAQIGKRFEKVKKAALSD